MIYLILLIVIILCSAVMDGEAGIANFFKKKYEATGKKIWDDLYYWSDSTSWDNKHQVKEWLIEKGFSPGFARFIAEDVVVVFTDMWHFAKAIMMACTEYMVAVLSIAFVNQVLVAVNFPITNLPIGWYTLILFIVAGSLFNFWYYKFRKL